MKTALITGINGFVGGYLAKSLLARGYNVVGLSVDFTTKRTLDMLNISDDLTLLYGDILDRRNIRRIMAEHQPEYVYHMAAMSIVSTAYRLPSDAFAVNCLGTANLLEVCRDMNVAKSILVASTDKVYGEGMGKKETDALNAEGVYDSSKVAMEKAVNTFTSVFDLPIVTSRACNTYGAFDFNRRIIPNTMKKIRLGQKPIIFNGDDSLREYIYVDDVCDALILLAENIEKTKGQAFNIGSGEVMGQGDIVKKIIEISGVDIKPEYADKPQSLTNAKEIHRQSLNCDKIRQRFGWKSTHSLSDGLRKTWLAELNNGKLTHF